jgi:hypothetical protein
MPTFEITSDAPRVVRGFTANGLVTFECKDNESAKELCDTLNERVQVLWIGKRVPT